MKLLPLTCCLCLQSLLLAGCQSFNMPDIQSRLSTFDFNLDSSSYVVRPGETLESIAFRYNTSVNSLKRLNPAAGAGVYPGMHLNVRQSVGGVQRTTTNASWSARDERIIEPAVVTAPTRHRQAVPIAAIATDQYLIGRERYNDNATQYPAIVDTTADSYAQQRGYPVEEVIDDDNFVLPNSRVEVEEDLKEFVGGWQWPLNGKLARDYDPRRPNGRGIEIVGFPGEKVYATRDGVVDWVARSPDGVGKIVIVRHDDDYLSIYSNAQDLFVSMRDTVRQGDPIASLGANAKDEPLLRFEISKNGNLLNPIDFLTPR